MTSAYGIIILRSDLHRYNYDTEKDALKYKVKRIGSEDALHNLVISRFEVLGKEILREHSEIGSLIIRVDN